jgi:L1 cell adhesion molecule like protein
MTEAMVTCDMLYESEDLNLKITRAKFEDLCKDLFEKCFPPIEQVLSDAKLNKS